ncbi:zinc finger BED domain-containing protein RICESLEEPER 2-like [Castanea sativa]|uniref:zinc finger BED domain-containing protein RICESLEEPER 2-like n=1 Tax=Castanea sativa TaxID=21020 RepID=UPI003F64AD9B
MNLIVMEGLKSLHESIVKIRNAIRYVKSSPSRYDKFKACVEKVKIASKGCVCLDVPTKWNSTYMMLENAKKFQRAFEDYVLMMHNIFVTSWMMEMGKKILGPPDFEHWDNVKVFVKFLKLFYEVTLRFFGSLYVTSNVFLYELCVMKTELTNLCESEDPLLSMMGRDMHEKFDKYWGDIEKLNLMMFVAIVLDQRYKLRFENFWFTKWNPGVVVENMTKKVKMALVRMYEHYCDYIGYSIGQGQDGSSSNNVETRPVNSSKYRLLSKVARDVLVIPLITVAYKSVFSTGGCVLDPFQSSLLLNIVEMLICAQNWLRATDIIILQESMEEVESNEGLESEFASQSTITVEEED